MIMPVGWKTIEMIPKSIFDMFRIPYLNTSRFFQSTIGTQCDAIAPHCYVSLEYPRISISSLDSNKETKPNDVTSETNCFVFWFCFGM